MPRHDDTAERFAQSLRVLAPFSGTLFVHDNQTWLFPGTSSRPTDPAALATALLTAHTPDARIDVRAMAAAMGHGVPLELTAAHLAEAGRALRRLSNLRDLKKLCASGHPALRRYRGVDEAWLATRRATFERAKTAAAPQPWPLALPPVAFGPRHVGAKLKAQFEAVLGLVAALYGDDAARAAQAFTTAPAMEREDWIATKDRLERLLDAVRAGPDSHVLHGYPVLKEATEQSGRRMWLSIARAVHAYAFTCFTRDAAEMSEGHLVRVIQAAGATDVCAGLAAVHTHWCEARGSGPLSSYQRSARLTLALTKPGLELPALLDFSRRELEQLVEVVTAVCHGIERCTSAGARRDAWIAAEMRDHWPNVRRARGTRRGLYAYAHLAEGNLSAAEIHTAYTHKVHHYLTGNTLRGTAAQRYLRVVHALAKLGDAAPVKPNASWLPDLVRTQKSWSAALVVAMAGAMRDQNRGASLETAMDRLAQSAMVAGPRWKRALTMWHNPPKPPRPAAFDALQALLGVPAEELDAYLAHRALAGEPAAFSAAIRAPLSARDKAGAQRVWLEKALAGADVPAEKRATWQTRLETLAAQTGRDENAVRRARHTFDRALNAIRERSLRTMLDAVTRDAAQALLGTVLPGDVPRGLFDALALLHEDDAHQPTLRAFLRDCVHKRPLDAWPKNRAWLESAAGRGLRVDVWQRGVDATITLQRQAGKTEKLRVVTSHDPFETLRMGSYFGTCLSLAEGAYRASTIINTLDANKQVLYVYDAAGNVRARKLLGLTPALGLVGFDIYSHFEEQDEARLKSALLPVMREFAASCGVQLAARGVPDKLHPGEWYDDGIDAWHETFDGHSGPLPDGWPADADAYRVWSLAQRSTDELGDVLPGLSGDAYIRSLVRLLEQGDAPLVRDALEGNSWLARRALCLVMALNPAAGRRAMQCHRSSALTVILTSEWLEAPTAAELRGWARAVRALMSSGRSVLALQPGVVLLPTRDLLDLITARLAVIVKRMCETPECPECRPRAAQHMAALLVNLARTGQSAPIARALQRVPSEHLIGFWPLVERANLPVLTRVWQQRLRGPLSSAVRTQLKAAMAEQRTDALTLDAIAPLWQLSGAAWTAHLTRVLAPLEPMPAGQDVFASHLVCALAAALQDAPGLVMSADAEIAADMVTPLLDVDGLGGLYSYLAWTAHCTEDDLDDMRITKLSNLTPDFGVLLAGLSARRPDLARPLKALAERFVRWRSWESVIQLVSQAYGFGMPRVGIEHLLDRAYLQTKPDGYDCRPYDVEDVPPALMPLLVQHWNRWQPAARRAFKASFARSTHPRCTWVVARLRD